MVCKLSLHRLRVAPIEGCGGGQDGGQLVRLAGSHAEGDTPLFAPMVGTIKGFSLQKFFFEFRGRGLCVLAVIDRCNVLSIIE